MEQKQSSDLLHPSAPTSKSERVVIVGTGETAALALEYFRYDSPYEVVAFSAEEAFLGSDVYCGMPTVSLEKLAGIYSPAEYRVFVAVSMTQLNRLRRRLYGAVKSVGFDCVSYVSSHACVMRTVELGDNVYVGENTTVQHGARVGNNVTIAGGTFIGHSSVIEDDVFIGPDVTVCGFSRVGRGSFVGAKSCIADTRVVAEDCLIGAGAIVVKDTEAGGVYVGNPARAYRSNQP
jgi:sugar O-acyltransferase (sialic acid O-acetyltransferase NeuD family)